jgi:hypothetical protein
VTLGFIVFYNIVVRMVAVDVTKPLDCPGRSVDGASLVDLFDVFAWIGDTIP